MNIKYVCIDKTTDSGHQNVSNNNIIVRMLQRLQPESPVNFYLFHTDYLDKENSSIIIQLLNKAMHKLCQNNVKYDNISLLISNVDHCMK